MRANPNKVSTRSQFGTRNVYIVQRLTRSSFTTPILYKRGVSATRVAAGVLEAGADKKEGKRLGPIIPSRGRGMEEFLQRRRVDTREAPSPYLSSLRREYARYGWGVGEIFVVS